MSDPAVARDIIESELIEEHHWLPQDIAGIPYKTLQKLFIIQKHRASAMESKANVQRFKSQQTSKSGKFIREV